ncbi:hypothetical protein DFH28DRAFT_962667 [Melampsora americana]|nr:hypothetical protein DFH28DRAFT_962667 [Melampsora americana]
MLLREFLGQLNNKSPQLSETLTVSDFMQFLALAADVQQRAGQSLRLTPTKIPLLPFLQSALSPQYPPELMSDLWQLTFPVLATTQINTPDIIRQLGLHPNLPDKSRLPERFLRAPISKCILCSPDQSYSLHVHSKVHGYLYDIDGAHAIDTVVLSCSNPSCGTAYRPSYYTRDGLRYYYTKDMGRDTDFIHIHCHYYMTRQLSFQFRVLQMLAHVSHFNLVNWFNTVYVEDTAVVSFTDIKSITPMMSEEVCRDGLILHSLMKHADRRGSQLVVSSSGLDHIRFDSAIETHLDQLLLEGSRYRDHYCSSCVQIVQDGVDSEDGQQHYRLIRAVVTDGLTIGHWRCSATTQQLQRLAAISGQPPPEGPCTQRLENINDRFCPDHFESLGGQCKAQPCHEKARPNLDTCANPDHILAWKNFTNRIKGNFSLTAILNRPGSKLHSDPTVHLNANTAEFSDLESLRHADESQRAHESARDGGESQAAGKYSLSRMRTHNDQTIVATCGIVLARKTFYNAKSVSAVRASLEETFPQGMPEVVFYNNACRLTEHIYTGNSDSSAFSRTVIPVDPFHHCSHADTDQFCKMFTDPHLFPDIQEDGRWIFNASAAELTNIWYGGFASMCRNMGSLMYNFFLEEMVELRNAWLTKRLSNRIGMEYLGEGIL